MRHLIVFASLVGFGLPLQAQELDGNYSVLSVTRLGNSWDDGFKHEFGTGVTIVGAAFYIERESEILKAHVRFDPKSNPPSVVLTLDEAGKLTMKGAYAQTEERLTISFLEEERERRTRGTLIVRLERKPGAVSTKHLTADKVQPASILLHQGQSRNNLKEIALALHSYHDSYGTFPPAMVCDAKGKPLLSWRVLVLPYLEEGPLIGPFRLNEPWDSEHNKALLEKMPKVFRSPRYPDLKPGWTVYKVPAGPNALFPPQRGQVPIGRRITEITDGTSNTLMVIEGADAVPWTKPEEYPDDVKKILAELAKTPNKRIIAAWCDGSTSVFSLATLTEERLKAFLSHSGGETTERPN